jgi:hypothetical protein
MTIQDCNVSEALTANYASYINGGRDREKLTPEQILYSNVIESEIILTAVYYLLYRLEQLEDGDNFSFVTSPINALENVSFEDIGQIANLFIKSRVSQTEGIIDKLLEHLNNGAE